jgi:hypothetical protein
MSKNKKLTKAERNQRRREEALKAESTVRGFANVSVSQETRVNVNVAEKNGPRDMFKDSKFVLPIAQIKKDLWKTLAFVIFSVGVISCLQRFPLFLDKFSAVFRF